MIEAPDFSTPALAPAPGAPPLRALTGRPKGSILFFYYLDLPRAADFYRTTIGLPVRMESDWCVIFELGPGFQLGLVNATAGSQRPIDGRNKGALISLEVDDLEACLERLKRMGVAAAAATITQGCCGRTREFKVHDPEGYAVEFFAWVDPQAAFSA
jgi:lactoylglutathione lyase